MAGFNNEPWLIQKYLPAIKTTGDKRIVILNGEPVGCFTRIPDRSDMRGNMRVGAKPQRVRGLRFAIAKSAIDALAPLFRQKGLFLAGLDVIGDYLTEIKVVTSPTGLVVADELEGRKGKGTASPRNSGICSLSKSLAALFRDGNNTSVFVPLPSLSSSPRVLIMVARIHTVAFEGTNVLDIDVQVQMSFWRRLLRLSSACPDKAVGESRERVRAALHALGLALPANRDYGQSGAGRCFERRLAFRFADCAGLACRVWWCCRPRKWRTTRRLASLALDGAISPVAGVSAGRGDGGGSMNRGLDLP